MEMSLQFCEGQCMYVEYNSMDGCIARVHVFKFKTLGSRPGQTWFPSRHEIH